MTKKKKIILGVVVVAVAIAIAMVGYCVGRDNAPVKETTKYVEVVKDSETIFDTSALEVWGGHTNDDGIIRMIGAWYYGVGKDGSIIVEDETGELWSVVDAPVSETDFLLLWITDKNTDTTKDDEIVKVWCEAHN